MRCIKLKKNFRSSDAVLQFVNLIFSHIMQGTDTVSYDPSEWLYPGATGYQSLPEDRQGVEVAFLPETETADFQVTWITHTIQQMLQSGYPVLEKNGTVRPCQPGDFCILLRKGKPCQKYAKALEALQIPVKK